MIYLFTDYDLIDDNIKQQLIDKLPPKRKKKALRFKQRDGQISAIVGYMLFLYGYQTLYNQTDLPDFAKDSNDKPYLMDKPDIHFNISHCKGSACCIFSDMPVGIDIQECRPKMQSAVERVCSEKEQKDILLSSNPDMEFCKIWSVKEAISKQSGDGIFRDIRNLNSNNLYIYTELIDDNKYMTAASLCDNDFTINKISLLQLLEL